MLKLDVDGFFIVMLSFFVVHLQLYVESFCELIYDVTYLLYFTNLKFHINLFFLVIFFFGTVITLYVLLYYLFFTCF